MKHEFRQQAEKQLKKLEKYGEMMEKRMENIESKVGKGELGLGLSSELGVLKILSLNF